MKRPVPPSTCPTLPRATPPVLPGCVLALACALPAQEAPSTWAWVRPPEHEQPATLWLVAREEPDSLSWDAAATDLRHLGRTFGERGVVPALVVETEPGDGDLQRARGVAVAALPRSRGPDPGHAVLLDPEGRELWSGELAGAPSHWIETALAGEPIADPGVAAGWALDRIADLEQPSTEQLRAAAGEILAANPRDPRGWVLRLIVAAVREGDLAEARRLAERACAELALEPLPLRQLLDGVLRCARGDRTMLEQAWLALVPVLADASEDVELQLVHLRTLMGLGREEEARALAERLEELVQDRPRARVAFAEALATEPLAPELADLAERTVEAAREADPADLTARMVHYNVLLRCRRDVESARDAVGELLRVRPLNLNNLAWDLLTRGSTWRRFPELALDLCRRMEEQGVLSGAESDTLALALFENGRIEEAVEAQEHALEQVDKPAYRARLERYRAAAAESR